MSNQWLVQIIFYIFAVLAVVSAIMAVSQNNPVRCVLSLVVTFFASAVLWILMSAEFLALILVLVYVGAVMTLFLFVVMMLNIDIETKQGQVKRYLSAIFMIIILSIGLMFITSTVIKSSTVKFGLPSSGLDTSHATSEEAVLEKISNTEQIGMVLYTQYVYAFELAAVLLLVAIISAISLAHRGLVRSKRQNITKQIMTQRTERVTLVSVSTEHPN